MYALVISNKFKKEIPSLSAEYPNTSFPYPIDAASLPANVVIVVETEKPSITKYQNIEKGVPAKNSVTKQWETTWVATDKSDAEKAAVLASDIMIKNQYINASKYKANQSFAHDGKEFAYDAAARSDIERVNGYVGIYGDLPENWGGQWKAIDNTYYAIPDFAAWKLFYTSIVNSGTANFEKAQALKATLALVTDPATADEKLAAIKW